MKIGFNCSSFDMLHAGHITMLKQEKENLEPILPFMTNVDETSTKKELEETEYEVREKIEVTSFGPVPMNKDEIEKVSEVRRTQKYPLEK